MVSGFFEQLSSGARLTRSTSKKRGAGYLPAITPDGSGKSGLLKVSFLWLAQL
jgi:hypothetical protein